MYKTTEHQIVPAQPNFWVRYIDEEIHQFCGRTPILAWLMERKPRDPSVGGFYWDVTPIVMDGLVPESQSFAIETPDGQVEFLYMKTCETVEEATRYVQSAYAETYSTAGNGRVGT